MYNQNKLIIKLLNDMKQRQKRQDDRLEWDAERRVVMDERLAVIEQMMLEAHSGE